MGLTSPNRGRFHLGAGAWWIMTEQRRRTPICVHVPQCDTADECLQRSRSAVGRKTLPIYELREGSVEKVGETDEM